MALNKNDPDLEHFLSIPWCAQLLNDPAYTLTPTKGRIPSTTTENALISQTLQSPSTIQAWTSFYLTPPAESNLISEFHALLSLGSGLNGHPNIVHGGLLSVILDDVMGSLLEVNVNQGLFALRRAFTAYLNVTYRKPVLTPGTVLVRVWFKEAVGRKCVVEGTLSDSDGVVLTEAEGLFVGTGSKL